MEIALRLYSLLITNKVPGHLFSMTGGTSGLILHVDDDRSTRDSMAMLGGHLHRDLYKPYYRLTDGHPRRIIAEQREDG
jgi:hypothetical protein